MKKEDTSVTAYPLCWPVSQPRTPESEKKHGRFGSQSPSTHGNWNNRKDITLAKARDRVIDELDKFTRAGQEYRTDNLVFSTNLHVRLDGLPTSGQKKPDDAAVAIYFGLDGESRCIPCDNYIRVEDNLAAVAATMSALRTIERHGSEMFKAAFTGFAALPSPDTISMPHWRTVLGTNSNDIDMIKIAYRKRAKQTHPDNGGSSDAFHLVQEAWHMAQQELGQ